MKKIIIIAITITVVFVGTALFISDTKQPSIVNMYEYYMDGVETDEKYSKITRKEAEEIALRECSEKYSNININDYKYMESMYWSNGNWLVCLSNHDGFDDGITLVVDENTKHLVTLIP